MKKSLQEENTEIGSDKALETTIQAVPFNGFNESPTSTEAKVTKLAKGFSLLLSRPEIELVFKSFFPCHRTMLLSLSSLLFCQPILSIWNL